MALGLLGKKLGMTRVFDEQSGKMTAVTAVHVGGNVIIQKKTADKDGYAAVQIGYGDQKESRVNKPEGARFKKAGVTPKRFVKEFRFAADSAAPESHPDMELFKVGQWVDVIASSKGKGFAGAVKRHGFGGLRMTHGSMMHRRTGSIGCRSTPGRVWKNQKMPGRMGGERTTVQNLKVVALREEDKVILISGALPGTKGCFLTIRPAKKK